MENSFTNLLIQQNPQITGKIPLIFHHIPKPETYNLDEKGLIMRIQKDLKATLYIAFLSILPPFKIRQIKYVRSKPFILNYFTTVPGIYVMSSPSS